MLFLVLLNFLEIFLAWGNDTPSNDVTTTSSFDFSGGPCTNDTVYSRRVLLDIENPRSRIWCATKCLNTISCQTVMMQTFADGTQSCTLLSDKDAVTGVTPNSSRSQTCRMMKAAKTRVWCNNWEEVGSRSCGCPKAIKDGCISHEYQAKMFSLQSRSYKSSTMGAPGEDVVYKKEDAEKKQYDMFLKTRINRGRFYLFGLHEIPNVDMVQEVCCWHGGYLAEIDDWKERNVLRNFKVKRLGNWDFFWLGGSDEREEGTWEFPYTKHPWKYTHWFPGEPNNRRNNEHCQVFFSSPGQYMLMLDLACKKERYHNSSSNRFICEIEVK